MTKKDQAKATIRIGSPYRGYISLLGCVLVVLKALGLIKLAWWAVLLPFYWWIALLLAGATVVLTALVLTWAVCTAIDGINGVRARRSIRKRAAERKALLESSVQEVNGVRYGRLH